jgi:adenosylcobinamide kinase/adenosylcobinamide-phosphate guanylyltransferase
MAVPKRQFTLITGGSRSGKSSHALALAARALRAGQSAVFIATAQPSDDEMRRRIEHHRRDRAPLFQTVEEPLELRRALLQLEGQTGVVVIDCLTLWISNLMAARRDDQDIMAYARDLAAVLAAAPYSVFVVTGEVGSGLVPMDPVGRRFRDLLGWTNQTMGRAADTILMMVAGYPLRVK